MLAVVNKRNPYLLPGTWVEGFDDGWQQVDIETIDSRLHVVRHFGLIYAKETLAPFVIRPRKRGLERNW